VLIASGARNSLSLSVMRRAAVIVGSPGHPIHAAPLLVGIQADVTSYEQFFLSDHGGAWERSEIYQFWHPRRDNLVAFLDSLDVDYSITVFCGHGWRQEKAPVILVAPDEPIWVRRFHTPAPRQLTIIDACQVDERSDYVLEKAAGRVALGTGQAPDPYRASCRAVYDSVVAGVGEQRTVMYGCNIGQTAGENPSGGYFSQSLVRLADEWGHANQAWGSTVTKTLDVRQVFSIAAKEVMRDHFPQSPQLESGRSSGAFPFAVA
jgi:hypothetical protein